MNKIEQYHRDVWERAISAYFAAIDFAEGDRADNQTKEEYGTKAALQILADAFPSSPLTEEQEHNIQEFNWHVKNCSAVPGGVLKIIVKLIDQLRQPRPQGDRVQEFCEMLNSDFKGVLNSEQIEYFRKFLSCANVEEGEWLPIESAPKDGTHILVTKYSVSPTFGHCGIPAAPQWWQAVVHWFDTGEERGFYLSSGGGDTEAVSFTHWRPLMQQPRNENEGN